MCMSVIVALFEVRCRSFAIPQAWSCRDWPAEGHTQASTQASQIVHPTQTAIPPCPFADKGKTCRVTQAIKPAGSYIAHPRPTNSDGDGKLSTRARNRNDPAQRFIFASAQAEHGLGCH